MQQVLNWFFSMLSFKIFTSEVDDAFFFYMKTEVQRGIMIWQTQDSKPATRLQKLL